MKKFRKSQCPYCGYKLSLLNSWIIKTQGEYQCPKCRGYSNIELDPAVYLFSIAAIILSVLIYLIRLLVMKSLSLSFIPVILIPYLIFYFLSVFLVRLRKPPVRKKTSAPRKRAPQPGPQRVYDRIREDSDISRTIIAESFGKRQKNEPMQGK